MVAKYGFGVCQDTTHVCGCPQCDIVDEDFNRANETPIGSPWTKLSGTNANLSSNVLDFPAAARYRHDTAYPGAAGESRHATVRVKFSTSGAVEVMVGLTDVDNYFAAALTYVSGGCSYLTAGIRLAGTGPFGCTPGPSITGCVQIPGITTGVWYTLEVCLIPNSGGYGYSTYDEIRAKVTLPNGMQYACSLLVDGPAVGSYAGIASSVAAQFDDFKFTYFRNSPANEHRTCPNCNTLCLISSDDFTTDEPCLWDVISGSYTVSGGVMTIGAVSSRIQHHIFHPFQKTAMIVTVRLKDVAGTTARVYVGSGYAQIEIGTNTHRLKLYSNTPTLLDDDEDLVTRDDSTTWLDVTVCYSRGVLSAQVTRGLIDLCADSAVAETANGYWASLGGDSGAVFDDFVLNKGYDTTDPSDSGCEDCNYCPLTCNECCDSPQPAGAYVVDFGAGGWTSSGTGSCECATCATVAGEYLVVASEHCGWIYTEAACDLTTCFAGLCSEWIFDILVSVGNDGTGCLWTVTVRIYPNTRDPTCPAATWSATYHSGYITDTQCNTMPVTLTKAAGGEFCAGGDPANCACVGTLPTTITLEAAV